MSQATSLDGLIPPHDLDAEGAVLAEVFATPNAFVDLADLVRAEHFYSEAHRQIWAATVECDASGKPIDIITVAAILRDKGRLPQVGGMAYLTQLLNSSPVTVGGNAQSYGQIVADHWRLRQGILICQRYAARGYVERTQPGAFLEELGNDVHKLSGLASRDRTTEMRPLLRTVYNRIAASSQDGRPAGIPTGIQSLDDKTVGLHRQEFTVIAARPGVGKAQPLSEPVLTPTGWIAIGSLRVGDLVIGASGRPTTVTGVFDQGTLPVFRVVFDDGIFVECSGDHLWRTRTRSERRRGLVGAVRTTDQIAASLSRAKSGGLNHSVPLVAPVEFAAGGPLPLDPWLLGALLGDGGMSGAVVMFSNPEDDVVDRLRRALPDNDQLVRAGPIDWRIIRKKRQRRLGSDTREVLKGLGLFGSHSYDKFIPSEYLRGSVADRTRLLQGLCDTDGYVLESGCSVEYTTSSPQLARDVAELSRSLGGVVSCRWRVPSYRYKGRRLQGRPSARMNLSFPRGDIVPVTSQKHAPRKKRGPTRVHERFILDVQPVSPAPCRCIRVDADDSLYVTRDYVVTHNTALLVSMALNIAGATPLLLSDDGTPWQPSGVGIFSLEMPNEQIGMRMIAIESGVSAQSMRTGRVDDANWSPMSQACHRIAEMPILIDDTSGLSIAAARAKVRRMKARMSRMAKPAKLSVVFFDYLQLMRGDGKASRREEEIGEITRGLVQLAKDEDIAVVAGCQLNRALESRPGPDKRPRLSDLRECFAEGQLIGGIDGAAPVPIESVRVGHQVYALMPSGDVARATVEDVWATGRKPVVRLRTQAGHELRATTNHPIFTVSGWTPIGELTVKSHVACFTDPSHVDWDEVVSIEPDGEAMTYDVRVSPYSNLVAGGVFAHNSGSIEQDANNVVFLYRGEMYGEKAAEGEEGKTELIIGKQRSGPTGTAYARYVHSCTRFENLPHY